LEFGVGDGTENNTLILLSIGWRGAWVGGENLAFDPDVNPKRLFYKKEWVSHDNINELVRSGLFRHCCFRRRCFERRSGRQ